jgi:hypothetical protein
MIKIHNLVAIALSMAFFISCGEEKKEDGSNILLNQAITTDDIPEINVEEINVVKAACNLLGRKEKSLIYSKGRKKLKYLTKSSNCSTNNTINSSMTTDILIKSGVPTYPDYFIFTDVILKNYSVMKEFCNKAQDDVFTDRFIINGGEITVITAEYGNSIINVRIDTGFKSNNKDVYTFEARDLFKIFNDGSKNVGLLSMRESEFSMNCSGNGTESYYAELKL